MKQLKWLADPETIKYHNFDSSEKDTPILLVYEFILMSDKIEHVLEKKTTFF